jgi:hypothetical protein
MIEKNIGPLLLIGLALVMAQMKGAKMPDSQPDTMTVNANILMADICDEVARQVENDDRIHYAAQIGMFFAGAVDRAFLGTIPPDAKAHMEEIERKVGTAMGLSPGAGESVEVTDAMKRAAITEFRACAGGLR